jgi:transcriptional regulator with XRE-family HTH domain
MKLGENLARLMKERRVSLSELSRQTRVAKTTLHSWLHSTKGRVDLTQLQKVARYFEVSVHQLAYGEGDPFEVASNEILKELFSGDLRVTVHKIERKGKD